MALNDCITKAILGADGDWGQINELLLSYYQKNGASSYQINDAEMEFLLSQGQVWGTLNDMWVGFLVGKGFTGALNDMLNNFWCGESGDGSDGGVLFCVRNLIFSAGHYMYVEFTEPPVLGAVGDNGTILVNGTELTTWTVDRIDGNRVYISGTPPLVAGDVVTYSYDPVTDGGVTNANGDQLCKQIEAPFNELSGLFRAAVGEGGGLLWLLLVGEATSTSTHADEILALDHEGIYRTWDANDPVWRGARQVTNEMLWSEDLTNSVADSGGATISSTDITFTGQQYVEFKETVLGGSVVVSFLVHSSTGLAQVGLFIEGVVNNPATIPLTPTPTRYSFNAAFAESAVILFGNALDIGGDGALGTFTITDIQVESATGKADQTIPSEYVKTEATAVTQAFSTENGNTVLNNVVTEAQGADLTDVWLQSSAVGTNIVTNSRSQDLWNIDSGTSATKNQVGIDGNSNVACLIDHTVSGLEQIQHDVTHTGGQCAVSWFVKRTAGLVSQVRCRYYNINAQGSIPYSISVDHDTATISGDSSIGSTGNYIDVISTPDGEWLRVTGDFSLVETHTIIRIQLRVTNGVIATTVVDNISIHEDTTALELLALPPIFTTNAAVTVAGVNYTHNLANIDTDNSATALQFSAEGVDVELLKIGSQVLLEYTAVDGLVIDDGVNRATYPLNEGSHTIGLAIGTTDGGTTYKAQLTIDGIVQTEVDYSPIVQGTIATTSTHSDLRSDIENTYAESQAKLLEWQP